MPTSKAHKGAKPTESAIIDPRFTSFTTDPRFRLPSKKHTRTKLDSRFSRMLKDDDFANTATVDRYGRKLSSSGKKKTLERLYLPEDEDEKDESESAGSEVEVEADDVVLEELKRAEGYDPARGGGFSSSSEDEEDEDDEDGGVDIAEEEFPDMQAESAAVEMGEVSSRFAVVNLDWDNIKSADLMAVFSSFVSNGGSIHRISIYPSEFGKERMDREELEGPPKEIFVQNGNNDEEAEEGRDSEDSEDDSEAEARIRKDLLKADAGEEFDSSSLRRYQLERLRYYYAVVVCSSTSVAHAIYEATDGTEYLSSANFFDLRFIPDGTKFNDKPRDECSSVPGGYKPVEFVTHALQHSKVKLTWDMDPEEATRKDAIKRAFSGSRAEIGENDLRAYLGSDSEQEAEEEEAVENGQEQEEAVSKLSTKELQRQKMRAALGLGDEPVSKSKKVAGPVGDMEVTFTAGLSSSAEHDGTVFTNAPVVEETTAERYIRLEKERKARRKERAKARREGRDPDAVNPASESAEKVQESEKEDLGFDDPFFANDVAAKEKASKSLRKEARLKRREEKALQEASSATQKAELELLLAPSSPTSTSQAQIDHFDINEIARAEKRKKKTTGKKRKEIEDISSKRGGLQESFEMDVKDERFQKVFGEHEFAIDPSHPRYKGTEGMKKLLEEGRRVRGLESGRGGADGRTEDITVRDQRTSNGASGKKRKDGGRRDDELAGLVEKVRKRVKS